jgi:hypothetical protein
MKGDFMKRYWSERITKPDGSKETMKEFSARIKEVKNDGLSA